MILRNEKTKNVRRDIIPRNSKTLWNAVNKAKDVNIPLPDQPNAFADFFKQKNKSNHR